MQRDPWSLGRRSASPGSCSTCLSLRVSPASTQSPVRFQAETKQHPAGLLGTGAFLCFSFLDDRKETATHSSTIAWKIPWTEEPGRL